MIRKILRIIIPTTILLFSINTIYAIPVFSNIYFLGDSLTDMGNFQTGQPFAPNDGSQTAPVTNWHQFGGAIRSKTTWAEFFAEKFGLGAYPSNDPLGRPENDFAVSGATTLYTFKNELGELLAKTTPQTRGSNNTLYVIWVGADDILDQVVEPHTYADFIGIFTELLDPTYGINAKHILVISIPDITLTPALSNCTHDGSKCTFLQKEKAGYIKKKAAQLLAALNSDLNRAVTFSRQLYPSAHIYFYDIAPLFKSLIDHPENYGFATTFPNVKAGICNGFNSTSTNGVCRNNQLDWFYAHYTNNYGKTFNNPDQFIFYNSIHPTGHTHTVLANIVFNWLAQQ